MSRERNNCKIASYSKTDFFIFVFIFKILYFIVVVNLKTKKIHYFLVTFICLLCYIKYDLNWQKQKLEQLLA